MESKCKQCDKIYVVDTAELILASAQIPANKLNKYGFLTDKTIIKDLDAQFRKAISFCDDCKKNKI